MSRRRKLEKFADLLQFPNVWETTGQDSAVLRTAPFQTSVMAGRWNEEAFGNDGPLVLELACGRGEYTLQLARKFPRRNFIGCDIKGARIWQGANKALTEQLSNVAFLRIRIENLHRHFLPGEVDEIWITFPDPFPRKVNRRLTAPRMFDSYKKILSPGGVVHLKTDDLDLYQYSLGVISQDEDLQLIYANQDIYSGPLFCEELEFKTYYEIKHLANNRLIKYLVLRIHG